MARGIQSDPSFFKRLFQKNFRARIGLESESRTAQTTKTSRPMKHEHPKRFCRWATGALLATLLTGMWHQTLQAQPSVLQPPQISGSNVTVNWNSGGALQVAPAANGPWTTVNSGVVTTSTATMALSQAKFFRVIDNGRPGLILPVLPDGLGVMPPIDSASVQRLPAPVFDGNSTLTARFTPGTVPAYLSNNIPIFLDNRLVFMNDRGVFPDAVANDGVFTMVINVDTNELQAANNHLSQQPAGNQFTLQFGDRQLLGTNPISAFPLSNFMSGLTIPLIASNALGPIDLGCPAGSPLTYDWQKTLMITDLSVVNDPTRTFDPCTTNGTPMGVWTFGYLMSNICNQAATGINPGDFASDFFRSWEFSQTINSDVVPARPDIKANIINDWMTRSIANGFPPGRLDLSIAPFRLCAIVNRVDLRSNTGFTYGGTTGTNSNPCEPNCHGGEGRFVFCAIDMGNATNVPSGYGSNTCSALPFLIIFEYCVPGETCAESKAWGAQWAALNGIPFGPAYNAALEAITAQFTKPGLNPSRPPNKSMINQLRSNEIDTQPWELREWKISCCGFDAGFLRESTPVNTPDADLDDMPVINSFIGSGLTSVPKIYPFTPFLGGVAPEPLIWDGLPSDNSIVMHKFALNTCNGCHTVETGTLFTHVAPRDSFSPSPLSGFLTGINNVPDPRGPASGPYNFADLDRRVIDLDKLVNCPCNPSLLVFQPVTVRLLPNVVFRMAH
jgi:hypothetical protein